MGIGAWTIGRFYDTQTTLEVQISEASAPIALSFPDSAPAGDTGGWHHYAFTFNQGLVKGYFDGTNFASAIVGVSALSVAGEYLSIAGWTFNETPWMDNSVPSKHPNNAWINGALDDIRIYNRALAPTEVLNLFTRVDKQAPAPPSNLRAKVDASSQIELDWSAASDNFRVDGYQILRNDIVIANVPGRRYVDTGLSAQTTYPYAVRAYDAAGNLSPLSSTVVTNTPAAGSQVEVIVDDAYGAPWVTTQGAWTPDSFNAPNFWESSFLKGTQNNGAGSVTFRPTLPEAGDYEVYVWNPGASNYSMWVFSSAIPVDIVHSGVTDTVTLNEQINYARWNYLGTYTFGGGTNGLVRIRTTGTGGDLVTADAVRFVK
jgi:hypothetical protein